MAPVKLFLRLAAHDVTTGSPSSFRFIKVSSLGIISYRLHGTDGVSIEAAKWEASLRDLGHDVTLIAGEGDEEVIKFPGLGISDTEAIDQHALETTLAAFDLVIVENICSLPLNPRATEAVATALKGRPAIMHDHDFSWHRADTAAFGTPPDDPSWQHVTINQFTRGELNARGIEAVCLYNRFAIDPPQGDRAAGRHYAKVTDADRLIVQPTRALARKNIGGGLDLAQALGAAYWLTGPAEDGYQSDLDTALDTTDVPTVRFLGDLTIDDVYAASDLVVLASTWEGFGNPALEAVTHRKPLVLGNYPVAEEIRSFGFTFFSLDEVEQIDRYLSDPIEEVLEQNLAIARAHFSLADQPGELNKVLSSMGFGVSPPPFQR